MKKQRVNMENYWETCCTKENFPKHDRLRNQLIVRAQQFTRTQLVQFIVKHWTEPEIELISSDHTSPRLVKTTDLKRETLLILQLSAIRFAFEDVNFRKLFLEKERQQRGAIQVHPSLITGIVEYEAALSSLRGCKRNLMLWISLMNDVIEQKLVVYAEKRQEASGTLGQWYPDVQQWTSFGIPELIPINKLLSITRETIEVSKVATRATERCNNGETTYSITSIECMVNGDKRVLFDMESECNGLYFGRFNAARGDSLYLTLTQVKSAVENYKNMKEALVGSFTSSDIIELLARF